MSEFDELLPDFIAEATDLIEQARRDLNALASGGGAPAELLNSIFRAVHTIKGGASIFKYDKTKAIAHELENQFQVWRSDPVRFTSADGDRVAKTIDRIETLLQNGDKEAADSDPAPREASPRAPAAEVVRLDPKEPPAAVASSAGAAASPSPGSGVEMLRVPVERVQRNLDVISEVFLIRNQMTYLVEKHFSGSAGNHEFVQAWESLDNSLRRSIGELESVAMSMRMMPLTSLFSRMEKTVRAYVAESGKRIQVLKGGEHTELDKKVLDALGEPLIHLIRNAMDHGIESPQERKAAGKPEAGTLQLSARVAGNEVILTVGDDGKGMSAEKIKKAAAGKGMDVSRATDEKSAIELIFLPGFSTAAVVTETSGRGVGMDVVKSAVERLGGSIGIQTKAGEGTTFAIRLPLSMSVIPAIVVRLNDVLYAVGTGDIIETRRIPAKEIQSNGGESYIKYRGNFIPCHDLERILEGYDRAEHPYQSSVFICIVRHGQGYAALRVGALENNTEIVVKPMSGLSPKIPYVTGISVLPTGQPVFVLSLGRLCREKFVSGGAIHEAA